MRLLLVLLLSSALAFAQSPYDSVDPFIGSAADGNTFPGASLPFGMMQWGPDTAADGWYRYPDKTIRGFSLTHISGAGCPIYADVPILPWTGEVKDPGWNHSYELAFSHDREQAHPGYYAVKFDNGISTAITSAMHAGIAQFEFPAGATRTILLKAGSSATAENPKRKDDAPNVEIRGDKTVVGAVHSGGFCDSNSDYTLYFAAVFAEPFQSFGTWQQDSVAPDQREASGHLAGAYVTFSAGSKPLLLKVGISFVSVDNALANLKSEIPGWNFDGVHAAAKKSWNNMFARVEAQGGTPDQRTIFYTGVYHMLLAPTTFSDGNGDYVGFDGKVRRLGTNEAQYANFSDWDIYRNVVQFQSLLLPQQTSQMMQSLVRDAEQSGWLPRWPVANDVSYVMGGDSSAILLSTAYAFGARGFDTKAALQAAIKGATVPGKGPHGGSEREHLASYLEKGYIPIEETESAASNALEFESADFAVSRLAAALGDNANATKLLNSAQNWRKLFDPESKFIRPRNADGKFIDGWDPDRLLPHRTGWDKSDQLGFEEGSTWQYTWMIPFNYAGLFTAIGGSDVVIPRLDKFFSQLKGWAVPYYTVTNEPDFCAAYAYNWAGVPWKTQEVVDRVRRETFTTKPDGLPGNDDLGATSGVYVWNALGMYPVIPGVGGLALASPMFPSTTVRFGNGTTLQIVSRGEGPYVQRVLLNGKPYDKSWLPLDALSAKNNRIEFELGKQPNKSWAAQPKDEPPSFENQ
jgi:predicted alpha-1,2-mannosidase